MLFHVLTLVGVLFGYWIPRTALHKKWPWVSMAISQIVFLSMYFLTFYIVGSPQTWAQLIESMQLPGDGFFLIMGGLLGCCISFLWYIVDLVRLNRQPQKRKWQPIFLSVMSVLLFAIIPFRIFTHYI